MLLDHINFGRYVQGVLPGRRVLNIRAVSLQKASSVGWIHPSTLTRCGFSPAFSFIIRDIQASQCLHDLMLACPSRRNYCVCNMHHRYKSDLERCRTI
jgi:hypothetical protein